MADPIELLNRDPEPSETGVPVDTLVSVDIASTVAPAIDATETEVYVNGNLAYDGDGGGFQTGWDGAGSATSNPDANTLRVVIDPTVDFNSEEIVTIRVVSETVGGANTIDTSYLFTIEDITPPLLVSAEAREKNVLRLVFDETMFAGAGTLARDVLNPANYALTRQAAPAANVVASTITAVTDTTVDITTNIELSFGKEYLVTVINAEDVNGNAIAAPNNSAIFTAFTPDIPAGRDLNLYRLMPEINRREDTVGHLRDFLDSLQDSLDLVLCQTDRFVDIIDLDKADEQFIDAMLCDMGNPFNFDLTLVNKRRLLRELVNAYQLKGTCIGIVNLVRFFLGLEVDCDEFLLEDIWILGESELDDGTDVGDAILGPSSLFNKFAFTIVSPVVLTATQRTQITDIVEYMKPAHTHFVGFDEPTAPTVIDHLELGLSELGVEWELH